jgi:thiosulfate/3-mercaptopyruvate sulfurtransferase
MFDTLVETEVLAAHLRDPQWVLFDCRFALADPGAGERHYLEGHIPGARYLHLERDLSSPVTPDTGRHPLPDARRLAELLATAGVKDDTQIVAYDDAGGVYAARLWWLARWLGHGQVAVLNGGWQWWLKEQRAVSMESAKFAPGRMDARADDRMWVQTAEVLELVRGRKRGLLIDARAAERYRGEQEPIDPIAGHVPGAINLPYGGNMAEDGRFRDAASLRRRFVEALGDTPADRAIGMCGSGVTACHNLLAMEIAGLKGARLYAGSWSEWIRDPARPVARTGVEVTH